MPNMTNKELNYIKDFLSWELLMAKKCSQYSSQEVDPNFKGIFNQAGQTHEQNYLNILNYLDQVSKGQGGGLQ